jgi:hypothetical protein
MKNISAKGKAVVLIAGLTYLTSSYALADAFPKSSEALGGPVISLELLGSFELKIKSGGGFLIWGGMATVFSPLYMDINAGPEAAFEFRKYFHERENKIWAFSFYSGVAYNLIGERYSAFTPGLKLTRKKSVNKLIQLEPYISLSYPFYFDGNHPFLPYLTFGYRFVFEKKKN